MFDLPIDTKEEGEALLKLLDISDEKLAALVFSEREISLIAGLQSFVLYEVQNS